MNMGSPNSIDYDNQREIRVVNKKLDDLLDLANTLLEKLEEKEETRRSTDSASEKIIK